MSRRMNVLGIVVLACCVLLAATAVFSPAQQVPGGNLLVPLPNLRYQLSTHGPAIIYLLDTQTGRAWRKIGDNEWTDLETPPTKEKKK